MIQIDNTHIDYGKMRSVWNGAIDRYPSAIFWPESPQDVVSIIRRAQDRQLQIAIRGSGHNVNGFAVCNRGIVIDLARMNNVTFRPKSGLVVLGAGVTNGQLADVICPRGFVVPFASHRSVSYCGFALGGGLSLLSGLLGLACDNILSARVVTSSGNIIDTDSWSHPELFWALKGGGGNFGIVTSIKLKAQEARQVLAGSISTTTTGLTDFLTGYRAMTENCEDSITIFANIRHSGADGFEVSYNICSTDTSAVPIQLAMGIDALGSSEPASLQRVNYTDVLGWTAGLDPAGRHYEYSSRGIMNLDDQIVGLIEQTAQRMCLREQSISIYHQHGAVTRVAAGDTAYAGRKTPYLVRLQTCGGDDRNTKWLASSMGRFDASEGWLTSVNLLGSDGHAAVSKVYDVNYSKLRMVKSKFDLDNLFNSNFNIKPYS